jgi:DHA3 family macrolide efflux protein-like MFS transporter
MKTWDEIEVMKKEGLPLWKNRDFILVNLAQLISGIGDGISKIALWWLSYKLTKSATTMGLVLICFTLPGIFSGLVSGALSDRFSKLKILVSGNVVLGFITVGFVLAYQYQSIFLVYILAFLIGIFISFSDAPFRAYLPEIFLPGKLPQVNTAVSSVQSLAMIIGPALGGVIMATGNVILAFLIDAATYLAAAALMAFLPKTIPKMAEGSIKIAAILRDIKTGVSYLIRSPIHRFLMIFFVTEYGVYCFSSGLIMPFCEQILSVSNNIDGSRALAIVEAVFGLGGFIGAFFIPVLIKKLGFLRTLLLGALLCVVELFAFGCISNIYILAVIITFTASAGPMLVVPFFTLLQNKTPASFIGRAMGAMDTVLLFVVSFSFGLGGVTADAVGVVNVYIITGAAILALIMVVPFLTIYKKVRLEEK